MNPRVLLVSFSLSLYRALSFFLVVFITSEGVGSDISGFFFYTKGHFFLRFRRTFFPKDRLDPFLLLNIYHLFGSVSLSRTLVLPHTAAFPPYPLHSYN